MDLHHRLLSRLSTLFLLYFLYSFHFISIDGAVNHPTKPITSFCIGGSGHACAVFDTFQMKCWGHEINLGMDDTGSNVIGDSLATVGDNIPYFSPGASLSITKVSCSSDSVCILLNTTDIKCFGTNGYGKLGIGNDNVAYIGAISGFLGDRLPVVNLGTGITASSVASGSDHVCVLVTGNKVKCFGFNAEGQLGYGNTNNKGYSLNDMGDNLPFVDFGTNAEIASIHTGTWHSCVILSAPPASVEKFKCWGQNSNGQLGYGTSGSTSHLGDAPGEMGENLPLVDLGSESKVKQLALGFSHSCALLNNNALKCWGSGTDGRLGSGSTTAILSTGDSMPTVSIDTLKTTKFVTAGSAHTCIVYDDNLIMKCFGDNQFGQLGQGDTTDRGGTVPTKIPNIPAINLGTGSLQISSIYTSSSANCVIFTDSSIKCFGANNFGMFAIGSSNSVGAGSGDMGSNLQFSELFSPTQSPTIAPTNSPTPPTLPTSSPSTKRPSRSPTTRRPSKSPTKSPTPPTLAPSDTPTQNPTDSPSPTKAPTSSPTDSPTKKVDDYLPSKIDCHQYTERAKCIAETNGECGTCVYFSEKVRYAFRVRVNFVMNRGGRFIDFDNPNATPPKTAFRDAIKAVIKAELGGKDTISITRIGQIYQTLGVDSGYTDFDINFDDSESDRVKARAFLTSKPNLYDYIDDLNLQLNKKMKTTGKNYITGRISIDNLNIVDLAQGKGSCGCNEETGSNAANLKLSSMVAVVVSILIAFLII